MASGSLSLSLSLSLYFSEFQEHRANSCEHGKATGTVKQNELKMGTWKNGNSYEVVDSKYSKYRI